MAAARKKLRKKPGWYIVTGLVVLICGYAALKTGQGLYRVWRLTAMMHREERLLRETVERLESLETEMDRLKNDMKYIEEIARRDYGMIRKGEEVYQMIQPDSTDGGGDHGG